MLSVPALRIQQFQQEFFLLNLSAVDVDRLVAFEVLGTTGLEGRRGGAGKRSRPSVVDWEQIERRVSTSDKAFQRPILRKKIEELTTHYRQCRDDGAVPAIPGAVLLTSDQPVEFGPSPGNPFVGVVTLPESDGVLRVLDGQHRLLALHALLAAPDLSDAEREAIRMVQVPALLFVGLPGPSVVEMFVTINSKHTRLNPSLLFSLRGRQLYPDLVDAKIHDTLRQLNQAAEGPLAGHIRLLGVGPGKVAQAGLAHELRTLLRAVAATSEAAATELTAHLDRFATAYFEEVARVFADAWTSKRHSTRSGTALRAFIQAAHPVALAVVARGGAPRPTIRAMLEPWHERIGPARFETTGAWRAHAAGGGKETTRALARQLIEALGAAEVQP